VIAHFAQAVRPIVRPLPDDLSAPLTESVARQRQLVVMINAEKQRLTKVRNRIAQSSFKAVLKRLQAERARLDKAIDKLIEASPLLVRQTGSAQKRARHRRVVARALIAYCPSSAASTATRSPP
jgi:transposase